MMDLSFGHKTIDQPLTDAELRELRRALREIAVPGMEWYLTVTGGLGISYAGQHLLWISEPRLGQGPLDPELMHRVFDGIIIRRKKL